MAGCIQPWSALPVLALTRTSASRSQISHRLHDFYTWCSYYRLMGQQVFR
jgi:hypothetical protein